MLFLIRYETLGLLDNTLTWNYEYSRSIRENLPLPIQINLSKKPYPFSCIFFFFFFAFLESKLNFQFYKKKWDSLVKYLWSYWLLNMCLFKCITGLLSGNPLAVNVLTGPQNSLNLQKGTFMLFFQHFVPNWVWKS